MATTLERRIDELEAAIGTAADPKVLLVRFVIPGAVSKPRPLQALVCGGQRWTRQSGEREEDFVARACQAARFERRSMTVLLAK